MIFFGVCVSGLLFVVNVYGVSNLFFYVSRVFGVRLRVVRYRFCVCFVCVCVSVLTAVFWGGAFVCSCLVFDHA